MSDTEDEIFAEATASAPEAHADSQPAAPEQAQVSATTEPAPAPQPVQPSPEPRQNGGDLSIALRKERDERRKLEAKLLELTERLAPPAAQELAPDMWTEPDKWGQSVVKPVEDKVRQTEDMVRQTREFYSERLAIQQHGEDKVKEAYSALDAAINAGQIDRDVVLRELQNSMDPYGDIMAWHSRHRVLSEVGTDPDAYEKRMREKILAELKAAQEQPATAGQPHAVPSAPSLPSLNRAIGNAGAPQSGSITDDDIFNAAPAFGKRKA